MTTSGTIAEIGITRGNMLTVTTGREHEFSPFLSVPSAYVRLDAAEMVRQASRRLLERGDYSAKERQRLHNATRVCRLAAVNRSPVAMLLDLAPRAPLVDALWFTELLRAGIIARSSEVFGPTDMLHRSEEDANRLTNIAQQEHRERRTDTTLFAMLDAIHQQIVASRALGDGSVAEMARAGGGCVVR